MRIIKYVFIISIFNFCASKGCGEGLDFTKILDYNFNYVGIVNKGNYTGNIEVQYFNIDSNKIISSFYYPPCLVGGYKTKLKTICHVVSEMELYPYDPGFFYYAKFDWENTNYFKIINHTNVDLDYFIFGGENQLKSVSLNEFQSNHILKSDDWKNYNDTIKTKRFQGEIAISTPIISYNLTPIYYLYFNDRIPQKNIALFASSASNENYDSYDKNNINFNYLFKDTSVKYCGGQIIEQKYSLSEILNIYKLNTNNLRLNISNFSTLNSSMSRRHREINNYFGIIQPKDSLNSPLINFFVYYTKNLNK